MKLVRSLEHIVEQVHSPLGPNGLLTDSQHQSDKGDDDGEGVEEDVHSVADDSHRVRVLPEPVFEGREDEVEADQVT